MKKNVFHLNSTQKIPDYTVNCVYIAKILSQYPFAPANSAASLITMNLPLTSPYNGKIQLKAHCQSPIIEAYIYYNSTM